MTIFTADWSNHDWGRGGMDFAAMARDGIAGGVHKLTDGLNYYVDPYFGQAIGRMRSAFGWYGAYHVLWGNRDLGGQADWLLATLDKACPWWRSDPNFALMSDNEPFGYNVQPTIGQVNTFGDLLRSKTGRTHLAYCPPWVYGGALTALRYPVVVSDYGSNPAAHYPDAYPGDGSPRWHGAALLQYGSATRMGGQNTCDANAYKGTLAQLRALTGGEIDVPLTQDEINKIAAAVWSRPLDSHTDVPGRTYDQFAGDLVNLRNELRAKPGQAGVVNPSPDGSALKQILSLAARPALDEKYIVDAILAGLGNKPLDEVATALRAAFGPRLAELAAKLATPQV